MLRYRSFLNASDNAPLYDIANAVKYLTENADQFGVQRENYALMGFSSGGHIVGLIGSDNEKFGYKAFGSHSLQRCCWVTPSTISLR